MTGFIRRSDNNSNNTTIIEDRSSSGVVLNEFGRFQDETEKTIQRSLPNFAKYSMIKDMS